MARSSSRSARVYPSKVDMWLVALLVASMGAALIGVVVAGIEAGPMRVAQGFFIMLAAAGFVAWVFLQTNYTLDGRELIVRSGPFRWRIPLDQITSVQKAGKQSILMRSRSGPALSLDRLEITYSNGKRLMISPADKEKFLADLHTRQGR